MIRGILFLLLWFVIATLLGGTFVTAVPPGGVAWPFYLFAASIPVGALLYARFPSRPLFMICYSAMAGAWFAMPIFYDHRTVLAGVTTMESAALKVALSAFAMSLICSAAFFVGRRFHTDLHSHSYSQQ